jgi:hypothetical protein
LLVYAPVEPRIDALKNELERILSLVTLEQNGQPLHVDGFRLRDVNSWHTGIAESPFETLGPLSGLCNAKCVFCMERDLPFDRDYSLLSHKEALTRLNHYNPQTGQCLFPSARPHMETLLNKEELRILAAARNRNPSELLIITTNGSTLTRNTIRELAALSPFLLKLSVNTTAPGGRKRLMGLSGDDGAILSAMTWLGEFGVPFVGSLVPWPGMTEQELRKTMQDISRYNPYGIRVRLPLYHRYMTGFAGEDPSDFWRRMREMVDALKPDIPCPLWIEPVQYGRVPVLPIIDGIIAHSPAQAAGLLAGDMVETINGQVLPTRCDIRRWFGSGALDACERLEVTVTRGAQRITHVLTGPGEGTYPYSPTLHHPGERFGMLFLPDFDLQYLDYLLHVIQKHDARKILLFCSPLTADTMEDLLGQIPLCQDFFQDRDLWIHSLEDTHMGGNTHLMDSRFVRDYEGFVKTFVGETGNRPDLLLIPDSFGSSWGIDFLGDSVYRIERNTGIPVALIPWHYTYGKED